MAEFLISFLNSSFLINFILLECLPLLIIVIYPLRQILIINTLRLSLRFYQLYLLLFFFFLECNCVVNMSESAKSIFLSDKSRSFRTRLIIQECICWLWLSTEPCWCNKFY